MSGLRDPLFTPPKGGDPLDDFIAGVSKATQARTRTALDVAATTPAPQARQQAQVAQHFGVAPDAVPAGMRLPSRAEWLIPEDRTLSQWLAKPDNAAQAHDDLDRLTFLSYALKQPVFAPRKPTGFLEKTAAVFNASWRQQTDLVNLRAQQMFRDFTPAEEAEAVQLAESLDRQAQDAGTGLNGIVRSAAQTLPSILKGMGSTDDVNAALPGITQVPVVGPLASIGSSFWQTLKAEGATEMDRLLRGRTATGFQVSQRDARMAAWATGTINATIELVGTSFLLDKVPGLLGGLTQGMVPAALKETTAQAVSRAIGQLTTRRALGTFVKTMGVTMGEEAVQEFTQALPGGAAEIALDVAREDGRATDVGDVLSDALDSGAEAAKAMLLLGLPLPLAGFAGQGVRIARAHAASEHLTTLVEQTRGSKLRQENPTAFADLVRASEQGATTVYVPAQAWATFFQAAGVQPEMAAQEILGDAGQYVAATELQGGTDQFIAIPIDVYLSKLTAKAGSDFHTAVGPEAKLSLADLSTREAEALAADLQNPERLTQLLAEMEAAAPVVVDGEDAVRQSVSAQLQQAGMTPEQAAPLAQLHALVFRSLADRSGRAVGDLQAERALRIVGGRDAAALLRPAAPLPADGIPRNLSALSAADFDAAFARAAQLRDEAMQATQQIDEATLEAIREAGGVATTDTQTAARIAAAKARGLTMAEVRAEGLDLSEDLRGAIEAAGLDVATYVQAVANQRQRAFTLQQREKVLARLQAEADRRAAGGPVRRSAEDLAQGADVYPDDALLLDPNDGATLNDAGELVDENGNILFQTGDPVAGRAAQAHVPPAKLSAVHNLSADNLEFAAKMGGIAVPSIAVLPESSDIPNAFGEITLIGDQKLADPDQVPVFDADAYTVRFPKPEYAKVPHKKAMALVQMLRVADREFESSVADEAYDLTANRPDPQTLIYKMLRGMSTQALFLREQGLTVEPIMRPKSQQLTFSTDAQVQSVAASIEMARYNDDPSYRDDVLTRIGAALLGAAQRKNPELTAEQVRKRMGVLLDEDDRATPHALTMIREDIQNASVLVVDRGATDEMLREMLQPYASAFKGWVEQTVLPLYGAPTLKVGGKKAPYTLDNIVTVMASPVVKGREQTMTFGTGNARAAAAERFRSLDRMREAAAQSVARTEQELETARSAAEALLSKWRDAVTEFYSGRDWRGNVDVWDAMDSSMKAIARWAQSGQTEAAMRTALQREGFRNVSPSLVTEGVAAGRAMLDAPVPYFEAKPQRAVMLSEFAGAAIPATTPESARQVLRDAGVVTREYATEAERSDAVKALRSELARTRPSVLFQSDPAAGNNGYIQFDPNSHRVTIGLLRTANLSTFLHESGHLFLEMLLDAAQREGASDLLVQDAQTIRDWLGAADGPLTREQHEQFARGFEQYLATATAPRADLRALYGRFRAWLISVYRDLRGLNVTLTPDVTAVMDRLIAGEQAVTEAEPDVAAGRFTSAEQAGMTEAQWAAYLARGSMTREAFAAQVQAALRNETLRESRQWWQDERQRRTDELTAALSEQPVYQAMAALRDGEKLPRQWVADHYGSDARTALSRKRLTTDTGGVDPSLFAVDHGFANEAEMIEALLQAEPLARVVAREVDAGMRRDFGDLLGESAQMAQAVQVALHEASADPMAQLLAEELDALGKARGITVPAKVGQTPLQSIRRLAADVVARQTVQQLRPAVYLAAERKAAKEVETALIAGRRQDAYQAKRRQLLNHVLYAEAVQAQTEVREARRTLKAYTTPKVRSAIGKVGQAWLEQIDTLLERVNLKAMSRDTVQAVQDLRAFLLEQQAQGDQAALALGLVETLPGLPFDLLSVQQVRDLRDAVTMMGRAARMEGRLLKIQRDELVDAARARLTDELNTMGRVEPAQGDAASRSARARRARSERLAVLRSLPSMVREITRGNDNGAWYQLVLRPLLNAGSEEAAMQRDASAVMKDVLAPLTKYRTALFQPAFTLQSGKVLTLRQQIAAVLNTGTETNLQRLREGRFRDGSVFTDGDINAMREALPADLLDMVQRIWDFIDTFWPETEALAKRLDGIAPAKVEALPFVVRGKQYRGGYYRLKYDPRESVGANRIGDKTRQQEYVPGLAFRSMTKNGSRMERLERVTHPVRLDLDVITEHVNEVIHDLTHAEVMRDVNLLMRGDDVTAAALNSIGPDLWDSVKSVLEDVTRNGRPMERGGALAEKYVRNVSISLMGFNWVTSFIQLTGYVASIKRVGAGHMAQSLLSGYRSPWHMKRMIEGAAEKSPFMRARSVTVNRDVAEQFREYTKTEPGDVAERMVTSYAFRAIGFMQLLVDAPTWWAGYNKAKADGFAEAVAIGIADQVVVDTQGSGLMITQSDKVRQRGWVRMFTAMYSFQNAQLNALVADTNLAANSGLSQRRKVAAITNAVLFYLILQPVLTKLVRDAVKGDGMDDVESYLGEIASNLLGMFPGLPREVSGFFAGFTDYDGPAGARGAAVLGKATQRLMKGVDDGNISASMARSANDVLGIWLGYPSTQVDRTVRGIGALLDGRTSNPLAPLVGPPRSNR